MPGLSKGAHYTVGDDCHAKKADHEWNMVFSNGLWKLVDGCWGAGFVSQATGKFQPRYTEHYLFTPPRDFARDHFPLDPKCQLLSTPLSLEEFENGVLLKPGFYKHGLTLKSHNHGIIKVQGQVKISIGLGDIVKSYHHLQRNHQPEEDFNSFVINQMDRTNSVFVVVPPLPGKYVFTVYGSRYKCAQPVALLSYLLDVTSVVGDVTPFPPIATSWGPLKDFKESGLRLSDENGKNFEPIIEVQDGSFSMTLHYDKPLRLKHAIYKSNIPQQHIVFYEVHKGYLIYDIRLPEVGQYHFKIAMYQKGSEQAVVVANYLIRYFLGSKPQISKQKQLADIHVDTNSQRHENTSKGSNAVTGNSMLISQSLAKQLKHLLLSLPGRCVLSIGTSNGGKVKA